MADNRFPSVGPGPESWLRSAGHRRWLEREGQRLLDFSKDSRVADGFAALDDHGVLPSDAVADTILTARMTHAYALGAIQGLPGCAPLAAHGVRALAGPLRDPENGGWLPQALEKSGRKLAYVHAFIGLAASSAVVAGVDDARDLLADAAGVIARRFWSESEGAMRESFAADWSDEEDYRGANSNMHSVEMSLALADVTGNRVWRERALRIATRIVHETARSMDYRLPEHFDREWALLREYNRDKPDHDLRPFGLTPGHFVEWSHLLLKLEAAMLMNGEPAPAWLLEDAIGLFETAVSTGWHADGAPGLVYTIDWEDRPSVRNRIHWVHAESITAAAALHRRTNRPVYEGWYRTLWDYLDLHMIDRRGGSWHNELDEENRPSSRIFAGKPDLYHAYQSTLTPLAPSAPSLATMLRLDN